MVSHNRPSGPERRKNSRSTNLSSLPYHRTQPAALSTTSHSSGPSWGYMLGDQPSSDLDHLNYVELQSPTGARPDPSLSVQPGRGQAGAVAPLSPFHPDSFFSESPILHQTNEFNNVNLFSPLLSSPDSPSWQPWGNFTPTGSIDTPLSDSQCGSLDNMAWSTLGSDLTDFPFFVQSSHGNSPVDHNVDLVDQNLPEGYFEYVGRKSPQRSLDSPRYSNRLSFDTGQEQGTAAWNRLDSNIGQEYDLSEQTIFSERMEFEDIERSFIPCAPPWTTKSIDFSNPNTYMYSGNVTFEPRRGSPYQIYEERKELFDRSSPPSWLPGTVSGSEGSPLAESNGSEPWKASPREVTPSTNDGESVHENIDSHWHILSAENGFAISSSEENHPRRLTPEQKRKTLECSPCAPGSPCEKCASLEGKRRFCKVPCFNDPIETLHPFLIPDMLVGHLTKADVESFVEKHTLRWGKRPLHVRMSWGSTRLLTANVVELFPREEMSEIGLQHQAISNGTARPALVRQKSPPLGIPLASVIDLKKECQKHVQEVIRKDLAQYPSIAYNNPTSRLSERLLGVICTWYQNGVADGEKCALAEAAIETHIIETILERSLILDKASIDHVQAHLGREFLPRSAPRCAQRQIKLAFFMLQRPRIMRMLEQWGKLMRNTADSNNKKWPTAFCVFVLLTLLMDQLITSAYYMCEDNIKFYGGDEKAERGQLQQLVRLMETELFERCKEIFHSRYKTRKGGNERFNPVRDGLTAWRKEGPDGRTIRLVSDLQAVMRDFKHEIPPPSPEQSYTNLGRLASIFLGDFLP